MATHNSFKYCVFDTDGFSDAETEGYNLNKSTDGNWGVGDKGDDHVCGHCTTSLPTYAPQAVKDYMAANGCLNHENALSLVNTKASAKGGSDGWSEPDEV